MYYKIAVLTAAFIFYSSPAILAQPETSNKQSNVNANRQDDKNPSGYVTQPQGNTGPIETKSGGAPAESPQGDAPPGMQAAPKGSVETAEKNGIAVGR